ncbi:ligase-associated DNA damage response endonuclease PdeM [Maribacter sp. 2308TA10-17]|uniref:ligase-associated DNA damage response endonuclease PdeM n=1 Tax=Maribacter sp. 2308TA10-17 TaxID=3386276 RepID=UPI0039BC912C
MTLPIKIQDHTFIMHPSGVLFWREKSMLIISDVHLGKVSHFRKFGAAVPQKAIQKNFELMNETITFFDPKTICFLGDLFHSFVNKEWDLFEKWVAKTSSELILVEGNHDIISPLRYEKLGVQVVPEIKSGGFLFTHHPEERKGYFNFSGHIHPAVRLRGAGRQSLRLPCFFKSMNQMIVPAFGEFTGTHTLKPKKTNEVFAITNDEVFQVKI